MTDIDICNSALQKLGVESIVTLNDSSKGAEKCKLRYGPCRQATLRMHKWNFATIQTTLDTPNVTPPPHTYTFAFDLPSDCLRVLSVNDDVREDWKILGRQIYTFDSTLDLTYITDLTDTTKYDSMYAEFLAAYLAWDICYAMTQSSTLKKQLFDEMREARRAAKVPDAQESSPEEVEADYFLVARLAGGDVATPKRNWPPEGV